MKHRKEGFTLIEMMLAISITVIVIGLSLPFSQNVQSKNESSSYSQLIRQTLRRAQVYARAVKNDSQWGVNFQATEVTLFSGSSYAARDTDFDEVLEMPTETTFSVNGDILFAKVTGTPLATLSQTVTIHERVSVVSVSARGVVGE